MFCCKEIHGAFSFISQKERVICKNLLKRFSSEIVNDIRIMHFLYDFGLQIDQGDYNVLLLLELIKMTFSHYVPSGNPRNFDSLKLSLKKKRSNL